MTIETIAWISVAVAVVGIIYTAFQMGVAFEKTKVDLNVVKVFMSWVSAMKDAGVTSEQFEKINASIENSTKQRARTRIIKKYGLEKHNSEEENS